MQAIAAETTTRLRGGAAACDGGLGGGQNYASTVWAFATARQAAPTLFDAIAVEVCDLP